MNTKTKRKHVHPPMRLCTTCGNVGRRLVDECQTCTGIALQGGQWVIHPRRRVLVWVRA